MKAKKVKAPFEVGDLVTSDYDRPRRHVVRTITRIEADSSCGSKFRAYADGGECCPTCKRAEARPTIGLDSAWFEKVDKE